MKFSFTGRHMDIGESLTSRAKDAACALATKYGTEFIDVSIVMKKDSYLFVSDITCKTSAGNSYHASDNADDPNVSFDVTLHKIEQQMQKKKKTYRPVKQNFPDITEFDNSLKEEDNSPTIVAEILEDLPLLSVSEAADRLSSGIPSVVVFENVSNKSVNVVYRRDDGNIGWIDYKVKR